MTGSPVLVVEDDPSVRGLLQTLLESEGFDVTTAPDGISCLAKVAAVQPRLVLLDLMMPDLTGLRVLEELRDDPELAAVPVVVVTGQVEAVPGVRALLGDDNVFVKPFSVDELMARVHDVVHSRD